MPSGASLPAESQTYVEIPYPVPPSKSSHRCVCDVRAENTPRRQLTPARRRRSIQRSDVDVRVLAAAAAAAAALVQVGEAGGRAARGGVHVAGVEARWVGLTSDPCGGVLVCGCARGSTGVPTTHVLQRVASGSPPPLIAFVFFVLVTVTQEKRPASLKQRDYKKEAN
ncbi:hypothetical protein NL676_000472 [Syzygium grande]|nr:hypothetical protein NL676_000472 [Syzygium grande]